MEVKLEDEEPKMLIKYDEQQKDKYLVTKLRKKIIKKYKQKKLIFSFFQPFRDENNQQQDDEEH